MGHYYTNQMPQKYRKSISKLWANSCPVLWLAVEPWRPKYLWMVECYQNTALHHISVQDLITSYCTHKLRGILIQTLTMSPLNFPQLKQFTKFTKWPGPPRVLGWVWSAISRHLRLLYLVNIAAVLTMWLGGNHCCMESQAHRLCRL